MGISIDWTVRVPVKADLDPKVLAELQEAIGGDNEFFVDDEDSCVCIQLCNDTANDGPGEVDAAIAAFVWDHATNWCVIDGIAEGEYYRDVLPACGKDYEQCCREDAIVQVIEHVKRWAINPVELAAIHSTAAA